MRKVLVLGMTLVVAGTTAVGAPLTAATAAVPEATVAAAAFTGSPAVVARSLEQRTYAYGTDARQQLDAYWGTPKSGRQPAVLLLHGGYWLGGDKASWKTFAQKLSARGYAAFAANYRLSQQKRWPAQRNDSVAALAYIKRHAARFHLDPNRVVVIGASAGGQLATMLGTYGAGRNNVRGVVALSPVNSPYLAYLDGAKARARASQRKLRASVVQLIGCTPRPESAACWDRVQDVTPVNHVDKGDAPMLLMHSAGDFVPYEQSIALRDALTTAEIPVTLTKVKGSAHGATLLNDARVEKTVLNWVYAKTR
ncbi:MAG: Alpha/beta hydrolase fold-3 domain protein [Actinomycetia bacterium]|nr:Alpha/beta hydrolase fold-3 domain protein [Actinomycetes bacterium]